MSTPAKTAKRPIFEDRGGVPLVSAAAPEYMDALESELENVLRKPGIQIQHVGRDILIVMVRDAFMEQNAAEISETGDRVFGALAKVLEKNNQTYIEISGYADAMRDQRAAGALTSDMAKRAAVYLVRHRIDPARLFIMGRGSARPIAPQTDMGRLMNRRVELRIAPVVK
jgi:outer membrane protein OmpA-like peptidoglycan-associated protein